MLMSSGKPLLPPPDVRFDTSDTSSPSAPPPAAPVARPVSLVERAAGMVVRIPPKPTARGSAAVLPPSHGAELEDAGTSLASGSVVSVVTEDAEAIHINERRDTIESPPAARPAPVAPIADDPTVPTTVPTTIAMHAAQVEHAGQSRTGGDAIAIKRGIQRLRMPRMSRRHDLLRAASAASSPPVSSSVSSVASSSSRRLRRLVIGSAALAGTCLAIGAIVWSCSSVSQAEGVAPVSVVPSEPAMTVVPSAPAVTVPHPATSDLAPGVEPLLAPALAPHPCSLDVRASVDGTIVWVDGTRIGAAPVVVPATCNTIATVELRHPRYATFEQAVAVDAAAPDGVNRVEGRLEREKTALTLWSEPAGAEVTYNGSVVGRTPVVVKVPRYEQGTVWFRAPDHEADWRKILPTRATKTVSIKLKGTGLWPPS
jgi:hypothetical protein